MSSPSPTRRCWPALAAAVLLVVACRTAAPPAPAPSPPPPVVQEPIPPPLAPAPEPVPTVRVTASSLNVRGEPSAKAPILGRVQSGDRLTLLEERGEWYRVEWSAGREGWVSARYARKDAPCLPDAAPQILDAPPLPLGADAGARGRVVVQAHVGADGSIVSTKVIENSTGDAALETQAIDEVRRIRFVPPVRDCRKVAFLYNYTRSF